MPLAADVNANLLRSLRIVQSLGEAVPHGGILKAVAGVGITILETAERVRQNKEECTDIARRAAEDIGVLKRLDEDEELSEDLIERLEQYHKVLEEVLQRVERLGTKSSWKRTLRASSVQDETKECLNRLNEAFRMYNFESSIAADTKLTTLIRGFNALSLRLEAQSSSHIGKPGKPGTIPMQQIEFGEEITRVEKNSYVLRIEHGKMVDFTGKRRAVILRRFEMNPEVEDEDRGLEEFKRELKLRGDLLNRHLARVLGVASSNTGRTKMIVVEAGTIPAYDHLQNLSGLEYLLEYTRITSEFVAGYRFLREHRGSWRGGYREVLLSAKDKQLCMGGLGRMDGRWEDSSWRMEEAFWRLRDGHDTFAGGNASLEENVDFFEGMRESVTRWSEEKTEVNGRDLWNWLRWWSRSSEIERRTKNSLTVGEIGWREGNQWHPISLVHHFPLAQPHKYSINASRWRDGEWETIVGTQIGEYTRWSIDVPPGEEIYLRMFVRSNRTTNIANFFWGSALSLAKDSGFDVRSLRLVSRTGLTVDVSLMVINERSSTFYYFAYPLDSSGSVPDPPGFWSFCPYPLCSDCRLHPDAARVSFHAEPFVEYEGITKPILAVLQDLELHSFLPTSDIAYASDPPFATIREVSDQQTPDPIITPRGKKRRAKDLFSIFTKKRKVTIS